MRYFVYGYYGCGNFGDELLLKSIFDEIRLRDKDAYFFIRNRNGSKILKSKHKNVKFTNMDKIFCYKFSRIKKIYLYLKIGFKYIKKSDYLIIGAGGLFVDKGKFNKSVFILSVLVWYAKLWKRKIIILGVSVDIIASPLTLFFLKYIFKKAEFIGLRDEISFAYGRYINSPKALLTADLVFLNEFNEFSVDKLNDCRITVGLCFIDYFNNIEIDGAKNKKYRYNILKTLLDHNSKYRFKYISFQEKIGSRDDEIYNYLISNGLEMEYCFIDSVEDVGEINSLDFIVTTRYHLAIIGLILSKNILIISHETKMYSIANEFKLPYISIDDLLADKIDFICYMDNVNGGYDNELIHVKDRARRNFDWMKGE